MADRAAPPALVELVADHHQALFRYAYRLSGSVPDAEDLTQEVFVQALRKIGQLREPMCIGSWLRSMTTRMAINRAMRRGPFVSTEPETLEATCVETQTPLSRVLVRERASQVRDGLDRLRRMDRDTLVAFYFNGHSLVEMSDEFDSPLGTIKRRLHVARKRLAKELQHMVAI